MRADAWRHFRAAVTFIAALAGLVACVPRAPQFEGIDITGADYAHEFALKDAAGASRTLADYRGKVVVIFFGYTQCPDVCPTTMAELANAMVLLGADADRVQVLFVTVDPQRDTPKVLGAYVPAFDVRFVGLYGDAAATAAVAREFKVYYQKVPGPTPDSYSMDHTAGCYVFDRDGHVRLFLKNNMAAAQIAHDLQLLLSSPSRLAR